MPESINIINIIKRLSAKISVVRSMLVQEAINFAFEAHGDTIRKGDHKPAVYHALETMSIVTSLTNDEEVIAAAVLHDVVEDTPVSSKEVEERFGKRVAFLVSSETENKRRSMDAAQTWLERKQEALDELEGTADKGVKMIFLGDKLSNMRSFYAIKQVKKENMWDAFNQKDPEMHHYYYRTIAAYLKEFEDTLAYQEYDRLIRLVFEEQEK